MGKGLVPRLTVLLVAAAVFTSPAFAQEKLVVWWNKSFVPQQDKAFEEIARKWEKKTGKSVELSFFPLPDHPVKMLAAFDSKIVPDVDFGQIVNGQTGNFSFEDKLLDISDVINPIRDSFTTGALRASQYLNGKTGKRSVYAFPIMQHGVNIHYWKDMLENAGFKESDIPKEWARFWDFWGDVQKRLRAKGERVFGLGLPYSTEATDTYQIFNHFLEAYKSRIMDDNGKLLVDDPRIRKGVVDALADYTRHYKAKNVPQGAISWKDIDNNLNFNNRQVVLVVNPTLTIPGSFFGKNDDYYYNKIRTLRWPAGPDGSLPTLNVSVHCGFIPKDSRNPKLAKDFVRFILEPENLDYFVKASNGGFFPVLKGAYTDPFFVSADPHRAAVYKNFTENPNRPYENVINRKYIQAQTENVMGRAIGRIVADDWTAEKAADEMFARVKQIVTD